MAALACSVAASAAAKAAPADSLAMAICFSPAFHNLSVGIGDFQPTTEDRCPAFSSILLALMALGRGGRDVHANLFLGPYPNLTA